MPFVSHLNTKEDAIATTTNDDSSSPSPPDLNPIDMEIFTQILELDEDDDFDFSSGMVEAFFTQADSTFDEMDQAL